MSDIQFHWETERNVKCIPEDAEDWTHEQIRYRFVEEGVVYEVFTEWFDHIKFQKEFDEGEGYSGSDYDDKAQVFIDWSTKKKVADKSIEKNGHTYTYDECNDKYMVEEKPDNVPHVLCGKCQHDNFSLRYGSYEIFAVCSCGHEMSVYSG